MLEDERQPENQCWSIEHVNPQNIKQSKNRIIRKFINSAIYVEKPISEMLPLRKTSPIDTTSSDEGYSSCKNIVTCSPAAQNKLIRKSRSEMGSAVEMSSNSDGGSQVTVKMVENAAKNRHDDDMKLSLTCLSTVRTCQIDDVEKEEMIRNWIAKKDAEKKRRKDMEVKMQIEKEKERQLMLEKERENFRKWLTKKKIEEEKKRKEKEQEERLEEFKAIQKEKKQLESELSYNLWLRRKKKEDLEKKIKEKLSLINLYEERQRRMEENERAYEEWLKNSKNKPKPIPLNQGLQSLCSSISVTYINPVPWKPNIEIQNKQALQ